MVAWERTIGDALAGALGAEATFEVIASGPATELLAAPAPEDVDAILYCATSPGPDVVVDLATLSARFERSRLVLVAGYVDTELADAAVEAGAHAVLSTTVAIDVVANALVAGPTDQRDPAAAAIVEPSHDREEMAARRAASVGLTPRQFEVLRLLAVGLTPDHVSRRLGISLVTCRDHIKALHRALDVTSTVELLVVTCRIGLLPELSRPMR